MREEDVPTEQSEAEEDTRIPYPDAHPRWARGDRAPTQQGSREPLRLIWRVDDRAMFRALARDRPRRAGALHVSATDLGRPDDPPRVAYAVGRPVGGAVVRNRVRRRLRAATREHRELLRPGWGYLIRASAEARVATYRELADWLRSALLSHRGKGSG
jgi:ribonuclease P protein component